MQDGVRPQKTNSGFLKVFVAVVLALALGAGGMFFLSKMYPEVLGLNKNPSSAQAEADKLLNDVGKLIALPTDEKPTIATVSDAEKLKEQAFFKNAQNGDKVLIYTNARKAILYRPSEKRIIEVGAVNINQQPQTTVSPSPSASPEASQ